jgi:hypothetical protein
MPEACARRGALSRKGLPGQRVPAAALRGARQAVQRFLPERFDT